MGQADRFGCYFCADCGHGNYLFACHAASFCRNQPCVRFSGWDGDDHLAAAFDCSGVHSDSMVWHERNRKAGVLLCRFVLCTAIVLSFCRQRSVYILETGLSALGNLIQNFPVMSTWMDPLRENSFPQNWTIYYWSYWMVWCVATPFFIGLISKGRTIKNTILGGYGWGLLGTFTSFIILGNYGLAQEMKHGVDISGFIAAGGSYAEAILKIFDTLPFSKIALLLLALTMIAFYATTFDSITMVVSCYSCKRLPIGEEPDKRIRTFWAVVFILLPIALVFSEKSLYSLQSVSIIAAFPLGIILLLIVEGFFKDAGNYISK